MFHAKVSNETRKELRKAAAKRGITMGALVEDLASKCDPETLEITVDGLRQVCKWVRLPLTEDAQRQIGIVRAINDARSEDVLASLVAEVV